MSVTALTAMTTAAFVGVPAAVAVPVLVTVPVLVAVPVFVCVPAFVLVPAFVFVPIVVAVPVVVNVLGWRQHAVTASVPRRIKLANDFNLKRWVSDPCLFRNVQSSLQNPSRILRTMHLHVRAAKNLSGAMTPQMHIVH